MEYIVYFLREGHKTELFKVCEHMYEAEQVLRALEATALSLGLEVTYESNRDVIITNNGKTVTWWFEEYDKL